MSEDCWNWKYVRQCGEIWYEHRILWSVYDC